MRSVPRAVLDINVLVSALISAHGAPARVLDLALAGEVVVGHDGRILAEWREVLARERFGFAPDRVAAVVGRLENEGLKFAPPVLDVELADPDDLPFLEVAGAAEADLVTDNLRHCPPEQRMGVRVVDPVSFLELHFREPRD